MRLAPLMQTGMSANILGLTGFAKRDFVKFLAPKRARSLVIPYWESESEILRRRRPKPLCWKPGSSRGLIRAAHRLPALKAMAAKGRHWWNSEGARCEQDSQLSCLRTPARQSYLLGASGTALTRSRKGPMTVNRTSACGFSASSRTASFPAFQPGAAGNPDDR